MHSRETAKPLHNAREFPLLPILAIAIIAILLQSDRILLALGSAPGKFPLDDAYIHLVFARSVLHGAGFAFNTGEPVAGSTAPGWTLLGAAASLGREAWLDNALLLLSIACYAAGAGAMYGLATALKFGRATAACAAAVLLLNGRWLWAGGSGMEICAFGAITLAGAASHIRDRLRGGPGALTGLLLGIAASMRPEGYLLFALTFADHALIYDPATHNFQVSLRVYGSRRAVAGLAIFLFLIAPYIAFCFATNGHPFPNTYYAKSNLNFQTGRLTYLQNAAAFLFRGFSAAAFAFIPFGVAFQMRHAHRGADLNAASNASLANPFAQARILWLWPFGLIAYNALLNPALPTHYHRYLMPILPFLALLAAIGIHHFCQTISGGLGAQRRRFVHAAVWAAILASCAIDGAEWKIVLRRNVANITNQHVKIAQWARDNIPAKSVVAAHDIGALRWFADVYVIDTFGLVTTPILNYIIDDPEMAIVGSPRISEYLVKRKPQYVVAYFEWFPIYAPTMDAFEELYSAELGRNYDPAAAREMKIWKVDWTRYKGPSLEPLEAPYGAYGAPARTADSATSPAVTRPAIPPASPQ